MNEYITLHVTYFKMKSLIIFIILEKSSRILQNTFFFPFEAKVKFEMDFLILIRFFFFQA